MTVEPHVFAAVLAAALMHAGWNAILKLKLEPILGMSLISMGAGICALPLLAVTGWPRAEAWPWVAGSAALHLAYYVTLSEAYRRGDMGQMYPIARGGAPLLTALASLVVVRDPLSLGAMAGIGLLATGVVLISLRGGRLSAPDRGAVGFALLTALVICGYTLVDGLGGRAAADPHAYSAAIFVVNALPLPICLMAVRGRHALRPAMPFAWSGLAGGGMSFGAYWIAIWAMSVAPIAVVAALRETSVLFAALIAVLVLKEPIVPARVVAALLIVAGIVTIRLG